MDFTIIFKSVNQSCMQIKSSTPEILETVGTLEILKVLGTPRSMAHREQAGKTVEGVLRTHAGVIGVIEVVNHQGDGFDAEALSFLNALAGSVAIAVESAVDSSITVLIEGETGVGKEITAGAIHANGPGSEAPFVTINCGALPANLLESELFGFSRGAFTGATRDKQGLFEAADGGTLFLDDIAETPPEL